MVLVVLTYMYNIHVTNETTGKDTEFSLVGSFRNKFHLLTEYGAGDYSVF